MKSKLLILLLVAGVLALGVYKVSSSSQKQRELEELLEKQRGWRQLISRKEEAAHEA